MADAEALERRTLVGPGTTPGGVSPAAGDGDGAVMSLVDHLAELRRRLTVSFLALGLASILGWFLEPRVLELLVAPLRQHANEGLVFIGLGDAFMIRLKIAAVVGLVVAMPVILFQAWRFVMPGLTKRERTLARPWLPLAYVFFLAGAGLAYLVLPFTVQFLLSFAQPGELEPLITASEYFGFVTSLILVFGLVMQYPLVIVFLAEAGFIGSARLRSARRYVLVAIAIFSAAATPGDVLFSALILGAIMYLLYESTIQLVRWRGH